MFTTLDENRLLHHFYRDLSDFLAETWPKTFPEMILFIRGLSQKVVDFLNSKKS